MRLPRETYQVQQTIETHLPLKCLPTEGWGKLPDSVTQNAV